MIDVGQHQVRHEKARIHSFKLDSIAIKKTANYQTKDTPPRMHNELRRDDMEEIISQG